MRTYWSKEGGKVRRSVSFQARCGWLAVLGTVVLAAFPISAAAEPGDSASAAVVVATDARLGGDEARTRFVVDLTRSIDLAAFPLADPYRVVVDLPQIVFHLPPKVGETGRGLIKAFRF